MTEPRICPWRGGSGEQYDYRIYPIGTTFKNLDGNYIYARINRVDASGTRWWTAVYIGQGNLSERSDPNAHHRGTCIEQNGATHFHCHLNANLSARRAEEKDLLANHNTPCNRQK